MRLLTVLFSFCFASTFLSAQVRYHSLFSFESGEKLNMRNKPLVKNAIYTKINLDVLDEISSDDRSSFDALIPLDQLGDSANLSFTEFDLVTDDFFIVNSQGTELSYEKGKYFTAVSSEGAGFGAFSFYKDRMYGILSFDNQDVYNIGQIGKSDEYIVFRTADFQHPPSFYCDTKDEIDDDKRNTDKRAEKCVNLYAEVDYATYAANDFDVDKTVDYILGLFAETVLIYKNQGINIKISKIKIWETQDSYSTTSSSAALDKFRHNNDNNTTDLCILIASGGVSLGGLAYVNVLCRTNHFAYANIHDGYSNVPIYSWSVNVITHELGHNLGSSHTHACSWNGNGTQIDDCGNVYYYNNGNTPEGEACFDSENPILPTIGGTVMSYCHLIGGIGVNTYFDNQVASLIRSRVADAECIEACDDYGDISPIADFQAEKRFTCEGGEIKFFDKSENHPTEWLWMKESQNTIDTFYHKFPVMKFENIGLYDISLFVKNAKGNDTEIKSEYITVVEGPKANFDYIVLSNSKIEFVNTSKKANLFLWNFGDGRISVKKNPKHVYKEGGEYVIELSATWDSCHTTSIYLDTIEVKIPLLAKFNYSTKNICYGDSVLFTVDGNKYDSIKWNFEGGHIFESDLEEVFVRYDTGGVFDVSLLAYSKYGVDTLIKNNLISVLGLPIPEFDFIINQDTVQFINNSQNGNTYHWDFGDGITSNEKNPVHIYNQNSQYTAKLIVKNTCDSSVLSKDIIISGVSTIEDDILDLSVYPNPSIGNITLNITDLNYNKDVIIITNLLGNTVYRKKVSEVQVDNNLVKINLGNLKGIYFLDVIGKVKYRKIKLLIF